MTLLSVRELVTEFSTDEGTVRAVDGVSFDLPTGGTLGIVGESGCGKSVTALSIMGLLPQPNGRIASGEVVYEGENLAMASEVRRQAIRGAEVSMIFQEPMTALNPVHTIGRQLTEVVALHTNQSAAEQISTATDMLARVGIPEPAIRMTEYPHQLSGGMRQRVVIAIALICQPNLVIADEPTTALDVTIQAQILELIRTLQNDTGMAMIMITHDLGVIAETCEQVVVMYAGQVVEQGTVFDIFDSPKHPYTRGLLASIPTLDNQPKAPLEIIPGMVPSLHELPKACRFANRCTFAEARCEIEAPPIEVLSSSHQVRCLKWAQL
ncbi:MAG: peptide ABC transporter ATP-binding protein [Gammaproteobacteria bacterium TMED95]|jgi:peptide/nickel transport system ATP-binding protein|nr:peptide ABC transporter ATP-binding protein [Gammaproteobacteria bacterium]OUV19410.1 MAG: peptide ABC transporter ATP-binding protein [Gammaproteobacteria bacterium TMED95]